MDTPAWDSLTPENPPAEQAPSAEAKTATAPEWDKLTPDWNSLKPEVTPSQSLSGQLNTVIEGIARPFGADVLAKKINPYLPEFLQQRPGALEEHRSENPGEALLGEVAGAGALLEATGGLGLAPAKEAGLAAKIISNAGQGALLNASAAVSDDLAFGDPNLNASKLLSDAGTAALWGAGFGGLGSAVIDGGVAGVKGVSNLVKKVGSDLPSVAPDSLGWLDKIRVGLFAGMKNPEGSAQVSSRVANMLGDIHDVTAIDDLAALGGAGEAAEAFQASKGDFLKHFGNPKTKKVDPEKVLAYITNQAADTSTAETAAFNNHLKNIKGLSGVKLTDATLNKTVQDAVAGLNEWQDELAHYATHGPEVDIEYGGPAHLDGGATNPGSIRIDPEARAKPYSTKMDVYETIKKGENKGDLLLDESGRAIKRPPTPNYQEGVTIGAGEDLGRVPSFGNERVSPFEYSGPSLGEINDGLEFYQQQVAKAQEAASRSSGELESVNKKIAQSAEDSSGLKNQLENLANAKHAINNAPEHTSLNALETPATLILGPKGAGLIETLKAIHTYGGDGGWYRIGDRLTTFVKTVDGIAGALKKVDEKIGDKARLIFTAGSSQARKLGQLK